MTLDLEAIDLEAIKARHRLAVQLDLDEYSPYRRSQFAARAELIEDDIPELVAEVERLREEMDGMVNKDWHGLMAILEDIYPEDTFPTMADDPERDAGPRIISLLRVVDGLRRRLDDVEARHAPVTVRFGDAPDELACRTCGVHYEYPVAWPCPTAKAARW